jgi:hypothetical protein
LGGSRFKSRICLGDTVGSQLRGYRVEHRRNRRPDGAGPPAALVRPPSLAPELWPAGADCPGIFGLHGACGLSDTR